MATPCRPTALALADEACDAIVIAFTAHEIRDVRARETFFGEVKRVLRPGGRAFLIEHVRDAANFLAFGPGFMHFMPRAEWLRVVTHAGLVVKDESRVTPFVMALTLERAS
jgi:ubiquinone/menaquinone biosynthesis C-methylase UbiE